MKMQMIASVCYRATTVDAGGRTLMSETHTTQHDAPSRVCVCVCVYKVFNTHDTARRTEGFVSVPIWVSVKYPDCLHRGNSCQGSNPNTGLISHKIYLTLTLTLTLAVAHMDRRPAGLYCTPHPHPKPNSALDNYL